MVRVFGLLSSTFLFSLVASLSTNKLISLQLGTQGAALLGFYRTACAFMTGILALGYGNILNEKFAKIQEGDEKFTDLVRSTCGLFMLQGIVLVISFPFLNYFAKPWLERLGIDGSVGSRSLFIIAVASFFSLLFQSLTAIARARKLSKLIATIQITMSLTTLLVLYPALQLGGIGIPILMLSGVLVASVLYTWNFSKTMQISLGVIALTGGWKMLLQELRSSTWLTFQSVVMFGAIFWNQILIQNAFGTNTLGIYNASYMLIDASILLLTASIRVHLVPLLGNVTNKNTVPQIIEFIHFLLWVGFLGAAALSLFAPEILHLFFSRSFNQGPPLLGLFCLGILTQTVIYVLNACILSQGRHSTYVLIDVLWISVWSAFIFLICKFQMAQYLGLAFSISSLFGAVIYLNVYRSLQKGIFWSTRLTIEFMSCLLCLTYFALFGVKQTIDLRLGLFSLTILIALFQLRSHILWQPTKFIRRILS